MSPESANKSRKSSGMELPLQTLQLFVHHTNKQIVSCTNMPRTKIPDLIWLRPQPNDRRPRFSREQITAAALKVAATEGFHAVTMKRIAQELDCSTMALYYYVRTKADIVALMHDAILAELLLPQLPANWRQAVCAIARRTRDVLLCHPWSIASFHDAQFGPNAMRHVEQSLAALDPLKLRRKDKLTLWAIVDAYVFGSAVRTAASLARMAASKHNPALLADAKAFTRQQLATGQFPRLASFEPAGPLQDQFAPTRKAAQHRTAALAAQFEKGLHAILDGLVVSMHLR
ncbi:TetR/AcrR family transcriptional regulator [Acidobacteria bacterium AB60]|nr:TetR/AcrR family transcriptional regulator [Acidobacteria bacterium AB60]